MTLDDLEVGNLMVCSCARRNPVIFKSNHTFLIRYRSNVHQILSIKLSDLDLVFLHHLQLYHVTACNCM